MIDEWGSIGYGRIQVIFSLSQAFWAFSQFGTRRKPRDPGLLGHVSYPNSNSMNEEVWTTQVHHWL